MQAARVRKQGSRTRACSPARVSQPSQGRAGTTPEHAAITRGQKLKARVGAAPGGTTAGLIDRDAELSTARPLLDDAAAGNGQLVLVEGPIGIGKSSLLEEIAALAEDAGMTVARARGSDVEHDYAFGVVRQLFEPLLAGASDDERASALGGAARYAEPALADDALPAPSQLEGPVAYARQHGVYSLAANVAAAAPLLLAVDNAHWADAASLRALAYLAKRIDALPVVLVLTLRESDAGVDPDVLEELRAEPLATALRPAPLSAGGAAALVREVLGAETDTTTCEACFTATGGNPMLLRRLVEDLLAERATGISDAAPDVPAVEPGRLSRTILHRVSRLGPDTLRLARAAAVLGDAVERRKLAAVAGIDETAAAEAAAALVKAEILADGERPAFVHPVVRGAVYCDVDFVERPTWHTRAAEVLRDEGAPPDRVAPHLVRADGPDDPWVAAVLRDAADRARTRGALDEAADFLSRALAEPEPEAGLLLELGTLEVHALRKSGFDRLRRALDLADDDGMRTDIGVGLGRALAMVGQTREAMAVLDRAVAEAGDADRDRELGAEAELIAAASAQLSTIGVARERLASVVAQAEPEGSVTPQVLALMAVDRAASGGSRGEAVELARRALSGDRLFDDENFRFLARVASALTWADELELASRILDRSVDAGRERGSSLLVMAALSLRSDVAFRRGRLADAEADARVALGLLAARTSPGPPAGVPCALPRLASAVLERAGVSAACAVFARAGDDATDAEDWRSNAVLEARGRLRIAAGRHAEGVADLRECGRRLAVGGADNPAVIAWRSGAALALLELGERVEARGLAAEELELARRFGAPRALGVALRAAALVRGGHERIDLLREATGVLEGSGAELELARALTDLGAAIRCAGAPGDARGALRRGLDIAGRASAMALAGRARDELVATGARPRRAVMTGPGALTPSERRAGAIARQGRTNREIARILSVSEKTVELHLRNAYRKLGIRSRAQLGSALEDDD